MILGVIPARFASTRLMGKPLAEIGGKPMIQHTYESAKKSKLLHDVIIAVDDERVYEVVRSFGGKAIMTPKDIATGFRPACLCCRKYDESRCDCKYSGRRAFY